MSETTTASTQKMELRRVSVGELLKDASQDHHVFAIEVTNGMYRRDCQFLQTKIEGKAYKDRQTKFDQLARQQSDLQVLRLPAHVGLAVYDSQHIPVLNDYLFFHVQDERPRISYETLQAFYQNPSRSEEAKHMLRALEQTARKTGFQLEQYLGFSKESLDDLARRGALLPIIGHKHGLAKHEEQVLGGQISWLKGALMEESFARAVRDVLPEGRVFSHVTYAMHGKEYDLDVVVLTTPNAFGRVCDELSRQPSIGVYNWEYLKKAA